MPERTVRHQIIRYTDPDTNKLVTVPRGRTHNFPQSVIDRHEPFDAFMPVEDTGRRPAPPVGTLPLDISPDASDEMLRAYLMGATFPEVARFVGSNEEEHPELAERVGKLMEEIVTGEGTTAADDFADVDPDKDAGANAEGITTISPAQDAEGGNVTQETVTTPETGTGDTAPGDGGARIIPNGTAPELVVGYPQTSVADYLARNPGDAQQVLQAEKARAEKEGGNPRRGVIRAAEGIIGSTD